MKKTLIYTVLVSAMALMIWFFFFKTSNNIGDEKTKINIIAENTSTIQAMMSIEEDYELKNPNIDLVFLPNTFDDAFNKSNQDFANKTGLYDIIIQYNFSLSSFVENDYIYLLDQLNSGVPKTDLTFEKDFFKNYWLELGYYFKNSKSKEEGIVKVGYPSAALTMVLMYNKDLFENEENKNNYKLKYGKSLTIPKTWGDYYQIAEFFNNEAKKTKGVCIEGGTGGFLYFELMNFIGGMGGNILESDRGWDSDANTKVVINSMENINALKFYKKLKSFNEGGYSNVEQYEQMNIMKKGRTAMAFVWSDMIYPSLKTDNGFDNRFGFAPIPGNSSILGGGAFFVNKQTKNMNEVSKFINYLMQEDTQTELALKGYCSPLRSVYSNPLVKQLPYAEALEKSLERADITLVAGADANIINEVFTTYVQKCWNDELSPEQALQKAQNEVEAKRAVIFKNQRRINQ